MDGRVEPKKKEWRTKMRLYLSGPMTGLPDHNRAAFDAAATRLRAQGHFVINPAELSALFGSEEEIGDAFKEAYADPLSSAVSYEGHCKRMTLASSIMSADLAAVRSCDAIYLLRGWENSRGAKKELADLDVGIGWWVVPMLRGGRYRPFQHIMDCDGYESFASCPLDGRFRADFAAKIAACARRALEYKPALLDKEDTCERLTVDVLSELADKVLKMREDARASLVPGMNRYSSILKVGSSAGGARAKALIGWNEAMGA